MKNEIRRPPRVFVEKGKLYVRIGKRKYLIKDQKEYSKRELMDVIINELVVRRKRRSKGKMTRREKKLNKEDLRTFEEFERLNRSQSKFLKLPPNFSQGTSAKQNFFNALVKAFDTTPSDVNVENRMAIESSAEKKTSKELKAIMPPPPSRMPKNTESGNNERVTFYMSRREVSDHYMNVAENNKSGTISRLKKLFERLDIKPKSRSATKMMDQILDHYGSDVNTLSKDMNSVGIQNFKKFYSKNPESKTGTSPPDLEVEEPSDDTDGTSSSETDGSASSETEDPPTDVVSESEYTGNSLARRAQSDVINMITNQSGPGKKYTGKGLNTNEIDKMMRPFGKQYLGTFPADYLKHFPTSLPRRFGFVMNLDKTEKPGSHWVAVLVDAKRDMSIEYYDSFAEEPSNDFLRDIKKVIDQMNINLYLKLKINKIIEQDSNTANCGWHSMNFLSRRFNDIPFREVTKYDDSKNCEKSINAFKEKFGYI